jgi:hypothetical protein
MRVTANRDERTISGLVIPYGEVGYTNVGAIKASKGVLTIPEDVSTVHLNLEHSDTRPVGKAVRLEETDAGIEGTFRIANTTAGNDLLAEVEEGLRTGFSVEFHDHVIRAGEVLKGMLSGVAAVVNPAFNSARVMASDHGELPTEDEAENEDTTGEAVEEEKAEEMGNENIAPAGGAENTKVEASEMNANQAFKAIAKGFETNRVEAALANVVHDDGDNDGDGLGEFAAAPAWLGEVYRAAAYRRKYVTLLTQGALTSYRETGFRWTSKPTVAPYTGNKAEVPSNGISAEPVMFGTQRWAHAADLDRRFIDFGDQEVVRAFTEAQVESYLKVTDADALQRTIDAATAVEAGEVPSGLNAALVRIIDGALALVAQDLTPTGAVVGIEDYRTMLLTPKDQIAEFLSQSMGFQEGGLEGFRIVPSANTDLATATLVLDKSTVKYKEFGGGAPVRVQAQHLSNGGVDYAVFGYTSHQVLESDGIVLVSDAAEGGAE